MLCVSQIVQAPAWSCYAAAAAAAAVVVVVVVVVVPPSYFLSHPASAFPSVCQNAIPHLPQVSLQRSVASPGLPSSHEDTECEYDFLSQPSLSQPGQIQAAANGPFGSC